jgi:hypothetical protein
MLERLAKSGYEREKGTTRQQIVLWEGFASSMIYAECGRAIAASMKFSLEAVTLHEAQ